MGCTFIYTLVFAGGFLAGFILGCLGGRGAEIKELKDYKRRWEKVADGWQRIYLKLRDKNADVP